MKGLTKRQREILDYIQEYISIHRHSPSYREMMQQFNLSSLATISKHIHVLKRKGVLKNEPGSSRSLIPTELPKTEESRGEMQLPFIGHITAGEPIETFPQMQTLAVPDFLVPNPDNTYVIRAKGNSLNEMMIAEGDLLIIEARQEVNPGESVVGMLPPNNTFIKKYFPEGNSIRLEGGAFDAPLMLKSEEFNIQGVVTGMLRLFS